MHINVKSYSSDDLLGAYEPGKDGKSRLLVALGTGLMFWLGLIGFVFWIAISNSFANGSTPSANDLMVVKVYTDGTKSILRWSDTTSSVIQQPVTAVPQSNASSTPSAKKATFRF